MELILASASPRRQELLRAAGIEFRVQPANVAEDLLPGEAPEEMCLRLAREKTEAVWQSLANTSKGTFVLGADTTVVVDHHILTKPENAADARRMLRLISGRVHEVVTGVCLRGANIDDVRRDTTLVYVDPLTDKDIDDYIATGEPMDKAGAYAIQGIASRWIQRIEGSYSNVVGLPVEMVWQMLSDAKVKTCSRG